MPDPVGQDGFDTYSNVLNPPAVIDSFDVYSNVFSMPSGITDGFDVYSRTELSTKSETLYFYYTLTSIGEIIPNPAPYPGSITIVGTDLTRATGVVVDGIRCSFRIISDTQIWAALPYPISSFDDVPVYLTY